jgi:hypothetical protein
MVNGRQRSARSMLVAQSALIWGGEGMDVAGFIETGSLGGDGGTEPYDPVMREAMVAKFEGRAEEFVNDLIRKAQAEEAAKNG